MPYYIRRKVDKGLQRNKGKAKKEYIKEKQERAKNIAVLAQTNCLSKDLYTKQKLTL